MPFTYTEYRNELITLAGILINLTSIHDSGYISKKANRPIRLGGSFKKRVTHLCTDIGFGEPVFCYTAKELFSVRRCHQRPMVDDWFGLNMVSA